jgi:ubiquitin
MQLFIKSLTNEIIGIEVELTDTIENVKAKIQNINNNPIEQQRLIYKGKEMENNRILNEYNIADNTTIILVLRLQGDWY